MAQFDKLRSCSSGDVAARGLRWQAKAAMSDASTPPSLRNTVATLDARLDRLAKRGVVIVDPRQCYVDDAIAPQQICAGVVLWPGTRLLGAKTYLGPGCEVGTEGPATIKNSVLERDVKVASGFVDGSLALASVKIGAQAHVRPGCILEEGVSLAHCVGLKQTILLSYVTLGSLINFCDCLMAGGTSEKVHAEVGSGYIHFNFTPWGAHGDKATASLIGDVVQGVFLDQPRIFLGGMGGMVGPSKVGFGSVAAAGQVLRGDLAAGQLSLSGPPKIEREWKDGALDRVTPRLGKNRDYIAQLLALGTWYRQVRWARAQLRQDEPGQAAAAYGVELIQGALKERIKQLNRFLKERKAPAASLEGLQESSKSAAWADALEHETSAAHVAWVQSLPAKQKYALRQALSQLVERLQAHATAGGWGQD